MKKFILIGYCLLLTVLLGAERAAYKYNLVYFNYKPTDFKVGIVKIGQQNDNTIIEKRNANGIFEAFLAYDIPGGEKEVQYKIYFYHEIEHLNKKLKIFVYGLSVFVSKDNVIAQYDPIRSLPIELVRNDRKKVFSPFPQNSQRYFLKQFDGKDFDLVNFTHSILFKGKLDNSEMNKKLRIDTEDTSYTENKIIDLPYPSLKDVSLVLESMEAADTSVGFEFTRKIELPLNTHITIGVYPYKISCKSARYDLHQKAIEAKGERKENRAYHFAEMMRNQIIQTIYFQSTDSIMDIHFDDNHFEVYYTGKKGKSYRRKKSPFPVYLEDYKGTSLKFKLVANAYESNYLSMTENSEIEIEIPEKYSARQTCEELIQNYPILVKKHNNNHEIFLTPLYRTKPFAIFSKPEGATLEYRRIYNQNPDIESPFFTPGDSPTFFQDFPYGMYEIIAEWYTISSPNSMKGSRSRIFFEISDKDSKNIGILRKKKNIIKYLTIDKQYSSDFVTFSKSLVRPTAIPDANENYLVCTLTNRVQFKTDTSIDKKYVEPLYREAYSKLKTIYTHIPVNDKNIIIVRDKTKKDNYIKLIIGPYKDQNANNAYNLFSKHLDNVTITKPKNWQIITKLRFPDGNKNP